MLLSNREFVLTRLGNDERRSLENNKKELNLHSLALINKRVIMYY